MVHYKVSIAALDPELTTCRSGGRYRRPSQRRQRPQDLFICHVDRA